jgi:thioredoxin reductase
MTEDKIIYPIIIIGAGPAGIATAIQLKRSGIAPLLIEKNECGGLLKSAFLIENLPGYYRGISGKEITSKFKKHLDNLNISPLYDEVQNISYDNQKRLFILSTRERLLNGKIIVMATGLEHRKPNIIDKLSTEIKEHIYFDIYNLNQPKDKDILIVGAGDVAFDYALNLSRENRVIIINRGKKIKAIKILQERSYKKPIIYKENTIIKDISLKNNTLKIIMLTNTQELEMYFDIVLYAIGREKKLLLSSQILKKRLELQADKVLYFIGDIANENFRQSSIAMGDGIKAAMEIYKKLKIN